MKISIRRKFAVGYIVIFCTFLLILNFVMKMEFEKANEKVINKEMNSFKQSSSDYITQRLLINRYETDTLLISNSNALEKFGEGVVKELSEKYHSTVVIYTENKVGGKTPNIDSGKVIINHLKNKTIVNCSYPLFINGVNRGTVSISKDYTDLFETYDTLLRNITIAIIISFIVIFLFTYLLSIKITIPITRLSKASRDISKGDFNKELIINSKDEIGELTSDFINMKNTIKQQLEQITKDKEKLLQLEIQRKVFFDNVTHELKTPLTTISGYAQIISEEGFEDKEFFKRATDHIKSEGERLHNMVIELLDISKLDVYNSKDSFKELNLGQVCKNVCEDMKLKADKYEMEIQYDIEEEIKVLGDENQLKQVLINIIDNAIKYGSLQSVIKVNAMIAKSNNCQIIIENRGEGIPQEKLQNIFEAFYKLEKQTGEEKGSSGLGLYISKAIIERHKGSIGIKSIENQSTKVIINLPVVGDNLEISH